MSIPSLERRAFFNWRFVKTERRKGNKRWAALLVLSIPLFFFFHRYVMGAGLISDISMLPTLTGGRYFLINKYLYHLTRPKRGEIVVLRRSKRERWYYVKRVIGLEGETVAIASGRVWINGKVLEEPYTLGPTFPTMEPFRVEKNHYFLLGDNRSFSEDSRTFGSVPAEQIEGKINPKGGFPLK